MAKSEAIIFSHQNKQFNFDVRLKLNGKRIYFVNDVRYLGVLLDSNLNWNAHTSNLATKLSKANGA